ncbi:MAG: haloacid dehalogenase-like hydrolase, partial [Sphaerochaetaceae bacterium]
MRHTTLTIFDFDGTLYPITSYDSEQMLVLAEAKNRSRLFKKRCNHFIEQDQRGAFNDTSFHQHYAALVSRTTESKIKAVADTLLSSVGEKEKTALLHLASISDLGILTCGTENLAWAFLEKLGIATRFSFIRGKRLWWNEKGIAELIVDITGPEAKATALDSLRTTYDTIIAIGDGPTDIPM